MLNDFLTPRTEFLNSAGRRETLHPGGLLGRLRRPVLLLARDLCAFELFETANLPASRRRQAARLRAISASPYAAASYRLVPVGADFGIWWWDLDRLGDAALQAEIVARYAARPETLGQPRGSGWRVVKLRSGYELQLWTAAGLIASTWRRPRVDATVWRQFTRLQREGGPEEPPTPVQLPLSLTAPAFAFSRPEMSRQAAIAYGGVLAAVLVGAFTLFLYAQGLQLKSETAKVVEQTETLRAATPPASVLSTVEGDRQMLAAYNEVESRTNPLSSAGAAIGILALHDLSPVSMESDRDLVSVVLPYSAMSKIDNLVLDFEESGYFYDVEPHTEGDAQRLVIEMKVRSGAPPLSGFE